MFDRVTVVPPFWLLNFACMLSSKHLDYLTRSNSIGDGEAPQAAAWQLRSNE